MESLVFTSEYGRERHYWKMNFGYYLPNNNFFLHRRLDFDLRFASYTPVLCV